MTPDEFRVLIGQWQEALRRHNYLQAMREALPPGPAADALDEQIAKTRAEVERLQKVMLDAQNR